MFIALFYKIEISWSFLNCNDDVGTLQFFLTYAQSYFYTKKATTTLVDDICVCLNNSNAYSDSYVK